MQRPSNVLKIQKTEIEQYAMTLWMDNENQKWSQWNGRQIRNAFQTAVALAEHEADEASTSTLPQKEPPALKPAHFIKVADAIMAFDEYLQSVQGYYLSRC